MKSPSNASACNFFEIFYGESQLISFSRSLGPNAETRAPKFSLQNWGKNSHPLFFGALVFNILALLFRCHKPACQTCPGFEWRLDFEWQISLDRFILINIFVMMLQGLMILIFYFTELYYPSNHPLSFVETGVALSFLS